MSSGTEHVVDFPPGGKGQNGSSSSDEAAVTSPRLGLAQDPQTPQIPRPELREKDDPLIYTSWWWPWWIPPGSTWSGCRLVRGRYEGMIMEDRVVILQEPDMAPLLGPVTPSTMTGQGYPVVDESPEAKLRAGY
ncbi:hypothetical protein N7512_002458 [Penicillium capsulatum]|nr:hypothetical protein N7512_002458 [Penicillium capsulatum]